jgi:nucleotide-binding universal stress UspA family protein
MQISKILLPVDFSPRSDGAAQYAKALACRFGSQVTIAHVFHLEQTIGGGPVIPIPPEWCDTVRNVCTYALEGFQDEEFKGMQVRRSLLAGDPAHAIVDLAHAEHFDLIVLPTRGHGRFRRYILGSVTTKVLHDADCPVMTGVHMEEIPHVTPQFRSVLCAVDFDSAGERALRWAAEFAQEFQAQLTLVHALPAMEGFEPEYFDQGLPLMLRNVAQKRMEEMQTRAGTSADVVFERGSVARVVHDAVVARDADLVVIGRHDSPGWMGRLRANAYLVIRESPCPVVSV